VDDEEFETIRRWAEGLQSDPRVELRAAAKAILMLAEEVETLQIELWNTRLALKAEAPAEPSEAQLSEPQLSRPARPELEPALRHQLRELMARAGRGVRRLQHDRFFHRG
jgi:hypothetical protein